MSKPGIGNSFGGAEVRFGVRSRVPWVGDENSGGFRILTVSGLRNFSKIFLKKVWRIVKKQYFCGPVSRERGRGGSRGKETFRKIFAKKFGGSKKRCTFAPPNGKRGDRDGREAGTGRGGSRGASPEADAERRVH